MSAGVSGGGAVVVSAFRCRGLFDLLLVWGLHQVVRRDVRASVPGYLGDAIYIDWRARVLRTVSLWESVPAIRGMGGAKKHIRAVRVVAARQIDTAAGVYGHVGDWRNVLFGSRLDSPDPLNFATAGGTT